MVNIAGREYNFHINKIQKQVVLILTLMLIFGTIHIFNRDMCFVTIFGSFVMFMILSAIVIILYFNHHSNKTMVKFDNEFVNVRRGPLDFRKRFRYSKIMGVEVDMFFLNLILMGEKEPFRLNLALVHPDKRDELINDFVSISG